MSTLEAPPIDQSRTINGLDLERDRLRDGSILWRSIQRFDPIKSNHYDERTGMSVAVIEYRDPRILWQGEVSVTAARRRFEHVRLQPFSQWGPDAEHDEYEELLKVSTYFAAKFAAQFKIRPRDPIGPLPLGEIKVSFSLSKARCSSPETRGYLQRHATGDWGEHGLLADQGELNEDQLWCPPLFGQAVQNAAALANKFGVVKSIYNTPGAPCLGYEPGPTPVVDNRRRSEDIHIWTIIELERVETVVFAPRFDV
jgi:hypothetical protein